MRVFTALPLFADGHVIGVVRMSRSSVSLGKVLWTYRDRLTIAALVSALLTVPLSLFLSRAISRPMERLSAAAERWRAARRVRGWRRPDSRRRRCA